jgi:hypothetical protein
MVDSRCSKCDWGKSTDKKTYFDKYYSTYLKDKSRHSEIQSKQIYQSYIFPPAVTVVFDDTVILQASDLFGVNIHAIKLLGSIEKQDYSTITNGSFTESQSTDTRLYVIKGHIYNLFAEYNMLKHLSNYAKPNFEIANFVLSIKDINDIKLAMPPVTDIMGDYNQMSDSVCSNETRQNAIKYHIQRFCELLLKIANVQSVNSTGKLFAEYFIKKTLRYEELMSKPGYFNWAQIYGDKTNNDPSDVGTSYDDQNNPSAIPDESATNTYDMEDVEGDDDDRELVKIE